ncbi:MAG: RluA family pseudouridine synthase [Gammaproteobacteria bacterium AqS3]|nr:RluA family pseudouridine synthase [Gammaproteobacteria bacterium AqS3]
MTGREDFSPVRTLTVDSEHSGRRLDNLLGSLLTGLPVGRIYSMIRRGEVRLNGRRCRAHSRVAEGDRLRLPPVRLGGGDAPGAPQTRRSEALSGRILHRDRSLIVLDKPAGLAVHGGSNQGAGGVIERLRAELGEDTLQLVHRLDRDTSGVLLIARRHSALRRWHDLLRSRRVRKTYRLLVHGDWPDSRRRVEQPLRRGVDLSGDVQVSPAGAPAVSEFELISRYASGYSELLARPRTGRTHQLRVHATSAGCPIVGDARYGDAELNRRSRRALGLRRMFLHAESIAATVDGERTEFSAPLPDELRDCLKRLQKRDAGQ